MSAAAAPDLDDWIAEPAIRIHHRRDASAPAPELWRAAGSVRLDEARMLSRIVRWRIPGLRRDVTFHDLFREEPFTVLEEGEGYSISGLCGRIWTVARDYPRIEGPEAFRAFSEPGSARVLFAHWVAPGRGGASALYSEARVEPVDRGGARRTRAIWRVMRVFEGLIGTEPLELAARRAEQG